MELFQTNINNVAATINPCQPGRDKGEKNKGSIDMKESTFLPEWDVLYALFFVEQNKKSFSLECCCESVFSTLKQVKSTHCSIHTSEKVALRNRNRLQV